MPAITSLDRDRAVALRRHFVRLMLQDMYREKPPVSLPGRPSMYSPRPKPPPPPPAKTGYGPRPDAYSKLAATKPVAEDALWCWTRAQLIRMDNRFRERLLRAFERGKESREAAANRIATPLW